MAETKTIAPKEGPGTRFWNWLTETQAWTSIFRHGRPDTDRNRVLVMLSNVFLHLHPVRIRKSGVKLRYTWCMGGISFFLFLVADVHRPAADVLLPADARVRLHRHRRPARTRAARDHARNAPLGRARDGHHGLAAHVPRVHDRIVQAAARVQLVGRRIMLVLTLLLSFTGYLLPWDQLAIWAITVGSNMARATPFLGHEGPGAQLLRLGDVPLIHAPTTRGSRCWAARSSAKARCCASTCCTASACRSDRGADGGAFLARAQGRRDFGTAVKLRNVGI